MKTMVFGAVIAAFLGVASFGQGTIHFNTFIPGLVDARVVRPDETGAGLGFTAQLFLLTGSAASPTYTPLFPTAYFGTTSAAAAYYVVPPNDPVIVPGVPAGSQATIVMLAWEGPSYETALLSARSVPLTITLGGVPPGGGAPIPDAILIGLQIEVPEPSTMGLALFGAALLLLRRK